MVPQPQGRDLGVVGQCVEPDADLRVAPGGARYGETHAESVVIPACDYQALTRRRASGHGSDQVDGWRTHKLVKGSRRGGNNAPVGAGGEAAAIGRVDIDPSRHLVLAIIEVVGVVNVRVAEIES